MTVSDTTVDAFVEKAMDEVAQKYSGAILLDGAKNRYFCGQLKRIVRRSIKTLQTQLCHGSFKPYNYEAQFRKIYEGWR